MSALSVQPRRVGSAPAVPLLSALGLLVSFAGLVTLIGYLSDAIFNWAGLVPALGQLNNGLAALAVALPLWLANWTPLQAEASARGDAGDRARRALVRRAYLYLFVFLFVVGLMVASGDLLYNLITHLLGTAVPGIAQLALERILTVGAMAAFLVYHLRTLQQDARASQQALGGLHAAFPVLVIVQNDMPLAEEIVRALKRQAPRLSVAVHELERGAPEDDMLTAKLIVLPSGLAIEPPEVLELWLSAYKGKRRSCRRNAKAGSGWGWRTARPASWPKKLRGSANGRGCAARRCHQPWSVAGCLGGLFALQMLALLFCCSCRAC
jgi:hypothetical protein